MFGSDTVCGADGTDGFISIGSLSRPEGFFSSISCMRSKRDVIWLAYKLYNSFSLTPVMTDLYLQPVTFKEASSSFIKSQPLHTPHGPSLPASRFLRQAAVLRNELLPTIWKKNKGPSRD